MRPKLTIGKKLFGGTAALFALAVILGYSGLSTANRLKNEFDNTVDRTVRNVVLAGKIGIANSEMISAQSGVILAAFSKDKAEIEKYRQIFQQQHEIVQKSLDELRPLIVNEEAKALATDVAALLAEWRPHYEEVVRQSDAGHVVEANRIRKDITAPIYNKIAAAANRLEGIQSELLIQDKSDVEAAVRRAAGLHSVCWAFVWWPVCWLAW